MAFIINGAHIGDDVIEDEFESLKEHYQRLGEVVCCDRDVELRTYAKENVVHRTLLEQESVKRFGEIDDALVETRFEALKAEHGGDQEFYDNTGFNRGDRKVILAKLKSSLTVDRLLEAEVKVPDHATEEVGGRARHGEQGGREKPPGRRLGDCDSLAPFLEQSSHLLGTR